MQIRLKQVIEAIEVANDVCTYYFDAQAGENVYLSEFFESGVANEALADLIESNPSRFYRYPTKHEIHEHHIMELFVEALPDGPAKYELVPGIHKKGAFRNFKNGIRYHRLEQQWYDYRAEAFRNIALCWCQKNGFDVEEQPQGDA